MLIRLLLYAGHSMNHHVPKSRYCSKGFTKEDKTQRSGGVPGVPWRRGNSGPGTGRAHRVFQQVTVERWKWQSQDQTRQSAAVGPCPIVTPDSILEL